MTDSEKEFQEPPDDEEKFTLWMLSLYAAASGANQSATFTEDEKRLVQALKTMWGNRKNGVPGNNPEEDKAYLKLAREVWNKKKHSNGGRRRTRHRKSRARKSRRSRK